MNLTKLSDQLEDIHLEVSIIHQTVKLVWNALIENIAKTDDVTEVLLGAMNSMERVEKEMDILIDGTMKMGSVLENIVIPEQQYQQIQKGKA